jgi:hypothetical protein
LRLVGHPAARHSPRSAARAQKRPDGDTSPLPVEEAELMRPPPRTRALSLGILSAVAAVGLALVLRS